MPYDDQEGNMANGSSSLAGKRSIFVMTLTCGSSRWSIALSACMVPTIIMRIIDTYDQETTGRRTCNELAGVGHEMAIE